VGEPEPVSMAPDVEPEIVAPIQRFAAPARPAPADDYASPADDTPAPPPRAYEELPRVAQAGSSGYGVVPPAVKEPAAASAAAPVLRGPLQPDNELISVLPSMLSTTRGQGAGSERPYAAMTELMPPPPLRPILPPELSGEPEKRGLFGRLKGIIGG
jgi:hypothetical protein